MRAPVARAHADRLRLGKLLWLEPYPDPLLEGLADWRASFRRDRGPPRLDRPTATDRADGRPAFDSYASDPDTGRSYTSG